MTSSTERPGSPVPIGPRTAVEEQILASRVVAILRLRDQSWAVDLCRALADGGITVMEITMGHPEALSSLERARQALGPSLAGRWHRDGHGHGGAGRLGPEPPSASHRTSTPKW